MPPTHYREFNNPKLVPGSFTTMQEGQSGIFFAFVSNGAQCVFQGPNAKAKHPENGPMLEQGIKSILETGCERIAITCDNKPSYGRQKHPQWITRFDQQEMAVAVITTDADPLVPARAKS